MNIPNYDEEQIENESPTLQPRNLDLDLTVKHFPILNSSQSRSIIPRFLIHKIYALNAEAMPHKMPTHNTEKYDNDNDYIFPLETPSLLQALNHKLILHTTLQFLSLSGIIAIKQVNHYCHCIPIQTMKKQLINVVMQVLLLLGNLTKGKSHSVENVRQFA